VAAKSAGASVPRADAGGSVGALSVAYTAGTLQGTREKRDGGYMTGKTFRDELAMAILPTIYAETMSELRRLEGSGLLNRRVARAVAVDAYTMAEAMLAVREEGEK